jgi:hypothetical protein
MSLLEYLYPIFKKVYPILYSTIYPICTLLSICIICLFISPCNRILYTIFILLVLSITMCIVNIQYTYYKNRINNNIYIYSSQDKFPSFFVNHKKIQYSDDTKLIDYHIASAYKPYLTGGDEYDTMSIQNIKNALLQGARFHYIEIDTSNPNNVLDDSVELIITIPNMIQKSISLEKVFQLYKSLAWVGINYPLILFFDCKKSVTNNKFMYEKLANLIKKYFENHFIYDDNKECKKCDTITMKEALNNIIIGTNISFSKQNKKNSTFSYFTEKLQKVCNFTIETEKKKNYSGFDIYNSGKTYTEYKIYNEKHINILVPSVKKTSFVNIINPCYNIKQISLEKDKKTGPIKRYFTCICIYYHYNGKNKERQEYIDFFKNCSFVKKK